MLRGRSGRWQGKWQAAGILQPGVEVADAAEPAALVPQHGGPREGALLLGLRLPRVPLPQATRHRQLTYN